MNVIVFALYPGLLITRQFDHEEFPHVGDDLKFDNEVSEILAITLIQTGIYAIEVSCAAPSEYTQWTRTVLGVSDAAIADGVELVKSCIFDLRRV